MYFITFISFFLIFVINLTYEQLPDAFEVREQSLTRPYPSVFSTASANWHLNGNTIATDKYIRLTSNAQNKAGGFWNMRRVTYPDWEIHVHFRIYGDATTHFGNGLVFWYVKKALVAGPVFGYPDYFHGLAIVLDTYANQEGHNHAYPYISAIVNNGSLHYDHDRDGTDINIAGCESQFRGRETDTLIAIRYKNDRLTVFTDTEGRNSWTECFSVKNVRLPTNYFFGFTAATGQLSDIHDIISVHTYRLDSTEQRLAEDRKKIIPSAPPAKIGDADETTSLAETYWAAFKFFLLLSILIMICLCGIRVFYYTDTHRSQRSRLY